MISGPVMAQVLEGEGAVLKNRELMGATNPKDAAPGTIRADFADSIDANAVHGSDSVSYTHLDVYKRQMRSQQECYVPNWEGSGVYQRETPGHASTQCDGLRCWFAVARILEAQINIYGSGVCDRLWE